MKNVDIELIHRTLDGDDSAFSELVKKYQKPVHALVWRKIGDFHTDGRARWNALSRPYP